MQTIAAGYAKPTDPGDLSTAVLTSGRWHRPIERHGPRGERRYACGWNPSAFGVWRAVFEGAFPGEPYCRRCWPDRPVVRARA